MLKSARLHPSQPQWHNRLARRTYIQYLPRVSRDEACGGCEFEPHLGQGIFFLIRNINYFKRFLLQIYFFKETFFAVFYI